MLPFSGFSNLFRQRKNVDFPVPDGPMIATTSPLLMFRSMPFKTTLLLNFWKYFSLRSLVQCPLICLYCRCILRYADLLLNQFDSLLYDDRNDPVNDCQRYIDFKVTVCTSCDDLSCCRHLYNRTDECKRCSLDQSDKGVTK